jgi:NarL family two-component system response regulator YdfI
MNRISIQKHDYPVQWMKPTGSRSKMVSDVFLTTRQQQVLQELMKGSSTKQMALELGLSERTVLMHIHALKERFGAASREQVILIALSSLMVEKEEKE